MIWPPNNPRSSKSCKKRSLAEAIKHNVLPLDDRVAVRFKPPWPDGPT